MKKIVILGAGVIGVTTAYFLKIQGFDVTVIDRQPDVALETSFANGGQISVCYSEPWANLSNIKKMLSWLGKEDSPLLFKPKFNYQQISWALHFLLESLPHNNRKNIVQMLKLSSYSRLTLQQLRQKHNLNYEQKTSGIMTFYHNQKSFESSISDSKFMQQFGCHRNVFNKEQTYNIEPLLHNSHINIFGSDYTQDDESGNAFLFTQEMKKICLQLGVKFLFNKTIISSHTHKSKLSYIRLIDSKYINYLPHDNSSFSISPNHNSLIVDADYFVCCLGSYSYQFLNNLGISTLIYPAKGYSATIDITDNSLISDISLTDSDKKQVFTKLGNKLRIAGTAEFNGYNLSLNKKRCDVLIENCKLLYPKGLDYNSTVFWTGLRPSTPSNVPIIEQNKKFNNLFINTGHGTLGWTMAAGSGRLISQIISKSTLFDDSTLI